MPSSMQIEFGFVDGDSVVAAGHVHCTHTEIQEWFKATDGTAFQVTHRFERSHCPVFIVCFSAGSVLYESALSVGVSTSTEWDSIKLGNFHTFVYRCTVFS